jgi:hypothetical protein
LKGETEVLGESLPQRHFVHHKSHLTKPVFEPGQPAVYVDVLECEGVEVWTGLLWLRMTGFL